MSHRLPGSRRAAAAAALGLGAAAAGCDVRLGAPQALWALWLLPLAAAFAAVARQRAERRMARFVAAPLAQRLALGVSRPRRRLKGALWLFGLGCALGALAAPKWGFTWEEVHRQGIDIVVALDVSESMLVQDADSGGKLTRLARAKRELTDLLRLIDGDRIALVAFAGTAFVECPLTLDYGAAEVFVDELDTDLIPVRGTALGDAIRTALQALAGGGRGAQAVVLITDGEDHVGDALAAAEAARAQGVRIYTVGIGRDEGAPIPAPGGGFHRDAQGNMVLSKLDEPTLRKIAAVTGGRYSRSRAGEMDLERLYREGIRTALQAQDTGSRRRQRWEERFQWFVGLGALALATEALIGDGTRRGETRPTDGALGG